MLWWASAVGLKPISAKRGDSMRWNDSLGLTPPWHHSPGLLVPVFQQFQLKSCPAKPPGASCSEHPFQSTFCSQPVFVPGRTASANTPTPLLTREKAFPSALKRRYYGEAALWAVLQGSAGNPCSVPVWELTPERDRLHTNHFAGEMRAWINEIKQYRSEELSYLRNGTPVCFPVCTVRNILISLSVRALFRHQQVKVCRRCTSKHQWNTVRSWLLFGWYYTCEKAHMATDLSSLPLSYNFR